MEQNLINSIAEQKQSMENTIKLISEIKDLDAPESHIEKYSGLCEHLLETERRLYAHKNTFAKVRGAQTIIDFDNNYKNEIQKAPPESIKNSQNYREMMEMAKDYFTIAAGGDIATTNTTLDDDLAIEENIITIDPLTKGPLENPVKNKFCGHVYGKATMEAAIRQGNIRCPQMGCMNKQPVAVSHLVVDHKLKMQLAAMRAKTQAEMEQDSDED